MKNRTLSNENSRREIKSQQNEDIKSENKKSNASEGMKKSSYPRKRRSGPQGWVDQ